jgi:glycosyltransferase involved in cell wall biosynthesis
VTAARGTAGAAAAGAAGPDARRPGVASVSGMFPCFNDEATIGGLVTRLRDTLAGAGIPFEIVVVDDGSTDGSLQVLERLALEVPELRVVHHPANRGYGAALRSGFAAARLDWVFYTDGDGQYDPAEVLDLLRLAGDDVDWVQGWKLARGDGWGRRVVGRAYHGLVRVLFGVRIRDTDCDFRLIRRSLLAGVDLRSSSGAICAELVYTCRRAGGRVAETPVHHYPRPHGRSQFFRIGRVARTLADVGALWVRLVVRRRPRG